MTLSVFNTKTRKIEPIDPVDPGHVRMYVCGPSVYDRLHVGHGRSYVFYDVLKRYLLWKGFRVTHVQNFTDVEENIANRAEENGMTPLGWADQNIKWFFEDADALRLVRASAYPRVSDYVKDIQDTIASLVEKGHAYVVDCHEGTKDGKDAIVCDVYFDVTSWPGFGSLVGQKPEDFAADEINFKGDRRHPMDFALWKSRKDWGVTWPSPWGDGRPGWHVECTVMAKDHLGTHFDLHGGGLDLVFPHHESEQAIAEAATGDTYCDVFVHNGFVTVNAEKMSKSLKNFITLRELLDKSDPEALRLFLASAHYRHPLDFDENAIGVAEKRLNAWRRAVQALTAAAAGAAPGDTDPLADARAAFERAMDDDLRFGDALEAVDRAAEAAEGLSGADAARALDFFRDVARVFGVLWELEDVYEAQPMPPLPYLNAA